jgi:hypothetical protein
MVVGQVPFNADTPFSIIHDHIYSPLPMPRAVNPKVPESVERVLLKALAKERADRYPDVDSLVSAFKGAWTSAGVPMQGTAITMRPAQMKAQQAAGKLAAPTVATVAAKSPARKRSPWPFIAVGILLVLGCVFVVFALRANSRLKNQASATIEAGTQAALAQPSSALAATSPSSSSGTTDTASASPTAGATVVPAVATAQALFTQNPNDPNTALSLSLAYWDAGQMHLALATLAAAANLAGPNNTQFFESAGDQFKQRQAWIASAAMYFRGVKSLGFGAKVPTDLQNNFHESLYKASVLPDLPSYLPFHDVAAVEQPIAQVAEARSDLYNGDPAQARILLNQVDRNKPGMPEASLLQSEMDARDGKTFEAKQLLTILVSDLNAPDWVRESAQEYLNKIP